MKTLLTCQCGQTFEAPEQYTGRQARCPGCGRERVMPEAARAGGPDGLAQREPLPDRVSGKAIASLVLGLLSFALCVLTGLPAIVLGVLGIHEVRSSKGRVTGSGLATAGIILGTLGSMAAVLVALLLPAVQASREASRRVQCVNNLRQIGLALIHYHDEYGAFPPHAIADASGKPLLSWRVALLPFLGQRSAYDQFHLDEPWDSPTNRPLADTMPALFKCPSAPDRAPAMTSYEVVIGPDTTFPGGRGERSVVRIVDVSDGTSDTILVGEAARPVHWSEPEDIPFDSAESLSGFGSRHPGGFLVVFADGSVRFLSTAIDPVTLRALLTRNGGERVSPDSFHDRPHWRSE
jgi:prepilin-type processing-associated H-X9-DG protein